MTCEIGTVNKMTAGKLLSFFLPPPSSRAGQMHEIIVRTLLIHFSDVSIPSILCTVLIRWIYSASCHTYEKGFYRSVDFLMEGTSLNF